MWTPDYAEKRLAWKRRHPLHVMLLRAYRIPRPVTVQVREEYRGCRSSVGTDRDLPFEGTPVMADDGSTALARRSRKSAAPPRRAPIKTRARFDEPSFRVLVSTQR